MEYEKYTNEYEFGGLNDNKKITTVFDRYQTKEIGGELYIEPIIEEGKCPALQEGYGINGQRLWVSLQNLHLETRNLNDIEAADVIISWCKDNVHPYYFFGDPYAAFDISQEKDAEYWDMMINFIGVFDFSVKRIRNDLQLLYDRTGLMMMLYSSIHMTISKEQYAEIEETKGFEKISIASPVERCHMIKNYIDKEMPKTPLALTLDENGEFCIAPAFTSVFDVAYYALSLYLTASPDYPLHWGARTGIGYCESCGKIYIKNGNRQKYCDDPECKKERNRRKAKSAYHRKVQAQADEEWA